jgi:predicted kinase
MPGIRGARRESGGQQVLVVLCGPSHSGKSTFARRLCKGFTVVSSDRIRKERGTVFGCPEGERVIWEAFESEKRKALREGRNVVLDACHMSRRARRHALQGPNARHRRVCVVFGV